MPTDKIKSNDRILRYLPGIMLGLLSTVCLAQTTDLKHSLNEQIISIPAGRTHSAPANSIHGGGLSSGSNSYDPSHSALVQSTSSSPEIFLETTIFKPNGNGPFPLLILNHGKAPGNPHGQERARFLNISREFVKRGYAVIIPMRTGFAKSGGDYAETFCNMSVNGQMQANDIENTLRYLRQQDWADNSRILVAGQSYGGLASMAFGTRNYPGVKGLINFAGGLRTQGGNCQWQASLVKAFAHYGARTSIPSLWFYGENDGHFGPALAAAMHKVYTRAGGQATLIAYGPFKKNAHSMSSSRDGIGIWWPETEKFLQRLNMPTEQTVMLPDEKKIPKSDFAALDDLAALPYLKEKGLEQYRNFLGKSLPRAFALSSSGAWSWVEDGDDPNERALHDCQKHSPVPCKLYAVDDYVVWNEK